MKYMKARSLHGLRKQENRLSRSFRMVAAD